MEFGWLTSSLQAPFYLHALLFWVTVLCGHFASLQLCRAAMTNAPLSQTQHSSVDSRHPQLVPLPQFGSSLSPLLPLAPGGRNQAIKQPSNQAGKLVASVVVVTAKLARTRVFVSQSDNHSATYGSWGVLDSEPTGRKHCSLLGRGTDRVGH